MRMVSVDVIANRIVCNERDCSNTDARIYVRGGTMRSLCRDCVDRFCESCGVRFDEENIATAMFYADGELARIICEDCVEE